MKTALIFIFIVSTFSSARAQQKELTKANVFKLFKNSIVEYKESISVGNNEWLTCNLDSAFFKNDTIKLYESNLYRAADICCDMVSWTFWKKDSFRILESQTCKEPSTGKISKDGNDFYTVKLEKREGKLFLMTFNTYDANRLVETFIIKSIDEEKHGNEKGKVFTLVRVK